MESGTVVPPKSGRVATHPAVRELAAALLPETPQISYELNRHLFATVPELADADDDLREDLRGSTEANVGQALRLLKLGVSADELTLPVEAAQFMRGLVRRRVQVAALLRIYRLGHAWFWDHWLQELQDRVEDAAELAEAVDQSSAWIFGYIDGISDVLVTEYGTERDRLVRSAEQLRAETVGEILAGEAIDEEVAGRRLGYELRRTHLALRVWSSSNFVRGLERAAVESARLLGASDPLIVHSAVASIDLWCGSYATPSTEALAALAAYGPPDGVRVAFGALGEGIAGFRGSHDQAVQTARIATLAGSWAAPVTSYAHVDLVALLASDLPRAREFVARRLGALASPAEPIARLRETLLAFLAANGSSSRVAKELFIHQNTVAYRIKKAEELLGRRVSEDPIELTCALTLAVVLGPAVLASDSAPDAGGARAPRLLDL